MRIAIITFDGFNEIDSFVAIGLLNLLSADGWKAEITSRARTQTAALRRTATNARHVPKSTKIVAACKLAASQREAAITKSTTARTASQAVESVAATAGWRCACHESGPRRRECQTVVAPRSGPVAG